MKKLLLSIVALLGVGAVWAQNPNLVSGEQVNIRILEAVESNMIYNRAPTAIDSQTIYLMGGMSAMGDDREGLAIGLGVGAGIVVFPFGLFCLCIKGEEAYIPNNTIITNVVVDDNYTINQN